MVRASRAISSSPSGTGTRRPSSRPPMSATSARTASTGRSVRPASHHTSAASSAITAGTAGVSERTNVDVLSFTSSRLPATCTTTGPSGVSTTRLARRYSLSSGST